MNKIDKRTWYLGLCFLLGGIFLGWLFFGDSSEEKAIPIEGSEEKRIHEHEATAEAKVWTCAMHPQIRESDPGQCPICGMDLIQLNPGGATVGPDEVRMTEVAMKIAKVQTITVQKSIPSKTIYLPGKVQVDERNLAVITSRFPGRIEKLYVDFTGQEVKEGQQLASIYSPALIQAQKELLEAASYRESNPSFYEAAVNKLKLWNLTDAQIQDILQSEELQYNIDIHSTQSGIVVNKNVSEGDYITEGQTLFEVAALDELWLLFDAYQNDLAWIEEGDQVHFTVPSIPGKTFSSEVIFIDPVIDQETRVASVRTEVENPDGELKPGMFAQGIVKSTLEGMENALVIPKSSILWTGKKAVVYVKDPKYEQPTFEYRELTLGPEAGDHYVVNEGLKAGEEIATNGVFKIDAAAQLNGKRSMMNPDASETSIPPMPGVEADGEVQIETEAFVEDGFPDFSKEIPTAFKNKLNDVVDIYLELKKGFVEGDRNKIQKHGSTLHAAVEVLDGTTLSGEAKTFWDEKRKFILKHAKLCVEAETMEDKRKNFNYLSIPLIKVVEVFGVDQTIYVQYCPMVDAYWLNEVEEIRNPFMPDMLSCGEVKDVIKK